MYTAGEDSNVKAWQTQDVISSEPQDLEDLQVEAPTRKRKKGVESPKPRFRPY